SLNVIPPAALHSLSPGHPLVLPCTTKPRRFIVFAHFPPANESTTLQGEYCRYFKVPLKRIPVLGQFWSLPWSLCMYVCVYESNFLLESYYTIKPMMDLLVMLCAKYHLNPSSHTMELVSANRNHIKFKPNALIGALEAEKVVLKPKGMEDKNRKTGPQMPEATVRLVINYKKTQKTILRVNPRVALRELLPAICEKCEFETQSTVLVRNVRAEEPLDLDNSLNDLGLREVYARDMRGRTHTKKTQLEMPSAVAEVSAVLPSLLKALTVSAPASPIQRKSRPSSMSSLSVHSPTYDSNSMLKKKRAPQPPRTTLQCGSTDHRHRYSSTQLAAQPDGTQVRTASASLPIGYYNFNMYHITYITSLKCPVSAHSPQSPPSGHPQAPTGQPLVHAHAPESCPPVHAQAPTSHPSMGPPAPESQSSSLLPSATKAGHLHYITDSEPRPKPSNELTREYIPKVGMTTYTIVPQRSLDKLRVFEVELTLESALAPEARHAAAEGEASKTPASSPPQPSNGRASPGPLGELSRSAPRSPMSPMESDNSGSKIKEKKVPPATRPKPASFRVPQHKRTPGSYVNSAAVRSLSVSDGCSGGAAGGGHIESPDGPQRGSYAGETHECFPPPPPAVQWGEEEKEPEGPQQAALPPPPPPQLEQEESETPTPLLSPKEAAAPGQRVRSQLPRQLSLPLREQPPAGLSLDKLRSFTAPKPYLPVMSSRFAQAVSSAVRRSHSLPYSSVGQAAHKVPLVLHRHGPIRGSSGLPESPTGPVSVNPDCA
uniref:Cordon-bleu ubiquitin-like domain-containing protein n=1 Tax=Electrophorus electricus TaxID=8005 RepID=A0A4W4HPG7_ELEEL